MCGITGHAVVNGNRPDMDAVQAATRRMAHRGPNGSGIASFDAACLGHRRLSIIDVTGSPQPWTSADGRYTIVFNGEIYNYLELRAELTDFDFRTQGDTEVLLAMYIRYGDQCLARLNGMFAFAIWDEQKRELFLARDRLGKKPLYYSLFDNSIAFASEIEPLFAFRRIGREIDVDAVQDFFAYQYIPAPRSIYRMIRKLPAAHFLCFRNGHTQLSCYWQPPLPVKPARNDTSLYEELYTLLEDSVRLRLRSDVPLGAFLSGGLDSSIIVGLMRRLGVEVESFHIGFNDASYDEGEYAKMAANHFGSHHRSRVLPIDQLSVLDATLAHFGEPFADPSAIPTWHLCRHTGEYVTVALSGDGADELFGGYRRYYARRFVRYYLALPAAVRGYVGATVRALLKENTSYYAGNTIKKLYLFIELAERISEAPADPLAQTFGPTERHALFDDRIAVLSPDRLNALGSERLDDVSCMILADILTYLPDDILVKTDRMSMAHALEVRNPFLDYRVVEFACRLPIEHKLKGGVQKRILRRTFDGLLPSSLLNRSKHGFAVPLGQWFTTELKRAFQETVVDAIAPWVERNSVLRLWQEHQTGRRDHGFKLWSLFVFHRWYHQYSRA